MSYFVILLTISALAAIVIAKFPGQIDEPQFDKYLDNTIYRLPEALVPVHCVVEITPYFQQTGYFPAWTFDGIVTYTVRAAESNISSLYIQENVRTIKDVSVTTMSKEPLTLKKDTPYERIRNYHFLKINLEKGKTLVYNTLYFITIKYVGDIYETPLSGGLFRGYYLDEYDNPHWYAATQLQPTHARQLFPSFDEPGFKSTFDVIVNIPLTFGETFSNMKRKKSTKIRSRIQDVFYTTPRMSAYLLTFHVSEDFAVIADNKDRERPFRIIARPNAAGQGEYALEVGPLVTLWLEDYLRIGYYNMANDMKNDHLASPYWPAAATEHWGLVSYRELRLLYDENQTSDLDKLFIGMTVSHELAHKWFGNLVTCRWWDNLWMNEGFASYFEFFALDAIDPSLELADQFNIMNSHGALSADSGFQEAALQNTVNTPAEVSQNFNTISYNKGASLLVMLKHLVSEDTFQEALHIYLYEWAYTYAFPIALYKAFDKAVREKRSLNSTFDIESFMEYWVNEPGYPVLHVYVNKETGVMRLRQERFYDMEPAELSDQVWPIPLTYTTESNPDWDDLTPTHVMTSREDELQKPPGREWVIFNIQQKGIYRVNYDAENWELIAEALKNNVSSIHHLNKAQIVNDIFALTGAGRLPYKLGFKVLDFLKVDTSYFSWYPAVDGFTELRNRFLHLPAVLAEFDKVLFEFLDNVVNDLGLENRSDDPLTTRLNRLFVLDFACNIGYPECTSHAIRKFTLYLKGGPRPHPNLRRHVFCEGIRSGGYPAWRLIHDDLYYSNNQADEIVMLRALGCASDDRSRQEYLDMVLTDVVKAQDRLEALTYFYMGGTANAKVALEFFKENIENIRIAIVLPKRFELALEELANNLDEDGLDNMETWLNENNDTIPGVNNALDAINSYRYKLKWGIDNAKRVLEAAKPSQAALVLPTTTVMLSALVALFSVI